MMNLVENEATWVVDSGDSSHATPYRDFFISYTPGDFGRVKMGNGLTSKIVGIGDVCLETGSNMRLVLRGVKHIPDLRLNLMSAGKLEDEGFCNTFNNGRIKLSRGAMVMARGQKFSTLYLTQAKICKEVINATELEDTVELWHKQLCHMSEKGIPTLAKRKVISRLDNVQLNKCSHCFAGKQNRVQFKSHPPSRKENILNLVYSDVCGPMKTQQLVVLVTL